MRDNGTIVGSFYLLEGAIYYSFMDDGVAHIKLWRKIVFAIPLFKELTFENKEELANACYATDRGRITITGAGHRFFGTIGCKKHESLIRECFNLPQSVLAEFGTDHHYKIVRSDQKILKDMLKLLRGDAISKRDNCRIYNMD